MQFIQINASKTYPKKTSIFDFSTSISIGMMPFKDSYTMIMVVAKNNDVTILLAWMFFLVNFWTVQSTPMAP